MTKKTITLKGEIIREFGAVNERLSENTKRQGLPPDYFSKLDTIQADDMIERPEQGEYEERESLD